MAHFLIIEDPFNRPYDIQSHEAEGVTILQWLDKHYAENGKFETPMMCVMNDSEVPFDDFATITPGKNDNVVFTSRAEGIVSIIITIISLIVSVYLALTVSVPENTNQDYNSAPSYTLQGRTNRRKLDEPIEVHYGLSLIHI